MNCVLKRLIIAQFLFLLGISSPSLSQGTYRIISGGIYDKETSNPVPFANIGIVGKSINIISNENGQFTFKVPSEYGEDDTLKVSFVGYQTLIQPLSAITEDHLMLTLAPATLALEEVLVEAKRKSALDIIREAVAAIPDNYDTSSVQFRAFYREETTLEDAEITYMESVIEIDRPAYGSDNPADQIVTVNERRKKLDRSNDYKLYNMLTLGGGAQNAIKSGDFRSFRKPHKSSLLNERNFKHYVFKLSQIISDGQRTLYKIEVLPRENSRRALLKGNIYVDLETMAFVRWELEMTEGGLDKENSRSLLFKKIGSAIAKANLKLSYFKETYNFENYNGKWYVKDVRRELEALVNSKSREMENQLWKTELTLTVTDINRTDRKSTLSENIYVSEGSDSQDPFWGNYNVIQPTSADLFEDFTAHKDSTYTPTNEEVQIMPVSNRQNGFTYADTLRGKLTPLRTCYDVIFYDLDIEVDIDDKFISGSNKIRFLANENFSTLQVDLFENMEIHRILYRGTALGYSREFNAVFVEFPREITKDSEEEIVIYYSGHPKEPNKAIPMDGGFMWEKDNEDNPWVQVVCQGSGASLWWPNKDHLSDEPDSMRISVTVPKGLINVSNGRLRRTNELPGNLTKYEWYVSYPINNYNVTLNIGKYAHLQDRYITEDALTLDYYVMPYNLEKAQVIFQGVKPMLASLEKAYGKFPFFNDGFKLMESLYPMEHQTAVSFGKIPDHPITESLEAPMALVWHEVAHEWWGNSVSCEDMADLWIHEAFATYAEKLYFSSVMGEEGELGFMEALPEQVIGKDPVVGVYDVNHIHYDIGDMYSKGPLVLHTFRNVLNDDELWSALLLGIQRDFRYQTINTPILVEYINAKTDADYSSFFEQYLNHTSLSKLMLDLTEKGDALIVRYRWQADVEDFAMPIDITISPDSYGRIVPTADWQSTTLSGMSLVDFQVDEKGFYVDVEMEER